MFAPAAILTIITIVIILTILAILTILTILTSQPSTNNFSPSTTSSLPRFLQLKHPLPPHEKRVKDASRTARIEEGKLSRYDTSDIPPYPLCCSASTH